MKKSNLNCIIHSIIMAFVLIFIFTLLTPRHLDVSIAKGTTTAIIHCPIIDRKGTTPVYEQNVMFSKVRKDTVGDTIPVRVDIIGDGNIIDCYSKTIISPSPAGVLYEAHVQSAHFVNHPAAYECVEHNHDCAIQVETN